MKKPSSSQAGFSLSELLVVVAIMAVLGTLSSMSFRMPSAANLNTQGARVSALLELARNTALSSRSPTAFVYLPGNGFQSCRLLKFTDDSSGTGTGTWAPLTPWEALPHGIVFDPTLTGCAPTSCSAVSQGLPTLTYQGTSFQPNVAGGYGYVIFLESGEPLQDTSGKPAYPCRFRLVQGLPTSAAAVTYTGAQTSPGVPSDYYDLYLNNPSGQIKISRP